MGVVIGETSIIGDAVLLYQGATLGGTGLEKGKRHPTIGNNVVIGGGAKILGNITVGDNTYIGANAVVIKDVPPNSTVVGVPGRITKQDGKKIEVSLDHIHVLDPIMQSIEELRKKIEKLQKQP
jgi:serine O-acetyltransferase